MHAPPTIGRRSRTRTFSPAFARYAAETRPLCPPPTMTASHAAATVHGARHPYVSLVAVGERRGGGRGRKTFDCGRPRPPRPSPPFWLGLSLKQLNPPFLSPRSGAPDPGAAGKLPGEG